LAKQKSIAKFKVAINKAKEELDNAIAGLDFDRAQEVKTTLKGLEEQVVVAEEELRVLIELRQNEQGATEADVEAQNEQGATEAGDEAQNEQGGTEADVEAQNEQGGTEADVEAQKQLERDILAKQKSIAKFKVAINKAKEELDNAIAGADFDRAHEVKTTLKGLEEQVVVAEEELRVLNELRQNEQGATEADVEAQK